MQRAIACTIATLTALCAMPARALSHMGLVERDISLGTAVLHRAVCARDSRPNHMHCHAHVLVRADGNPVTRTRAATIGAAPSGYGPADLRSAYRLAVRGSATTVVAIVDAYGYASAEADLAIYRNMYGLPACTRASGCLTVVNQRGGTQAPQADTGWAQEQALDLDMVSVTCPNCRILLIQADDDTIDNLAAAVVLAASRGVSAISNSYGGTEPGSKAYARIYQRPGIAVTASAGDTGYGAEFPASTPYTIAVGGTRLVRAPGTDRGWAETVWADTGGGCSAIYPKPAWQTDTLCTMRMTNDVAAVAAPATGVAGYGPIAVNTSAWMVFGGTSIGAPLIAGIFAAAGAKPIAARSFYRRPYELFDVTSGADGQCGGTYFCIAQTGYDGPTGNGTPHGKGAF